MSSGDTIAQYVQWKVCLRKWLWIQIRDNMQKTLNPQQFFSVYAALLKFLRNLL